MAVILTQGLTKRYGNLVAVKGIDLAVERGEIFGLIGPDGAGKTTTFHILSGVMELSGGKVTVLGKSPQEARLAIGYLTQQMSLYLDLSVAENLRYSAGLRQVPEGLFAQRSEHYLNLMDLARFRDRLAGRLSGGMKQKLALCCALVAQPEILLLDEPTTGVDPVSRRDFWDILAAVASQGMTIIVATPYLDEAERCHRLALMYDGQIQEVGSLGQLRQNLGLQRLEVIPDQLEAAEAALEAAIGPVIVDVQTFGDRLDVLVPEPDRGKAAVLATLAEQRITSYSIAITPPTLENVFVTRLRSAGEDPPFIPFPKTRPARKPDYPAIAAQNLRREFGGFVAVENVQLEVNYGDIYGLLGANGAGKTTTIKMLCGLLPPTRGQISLAGATGNLRRADIRQRIGYMSQKFTLYDDLTIRQNLEFYCGVYGVPVRSRPSKIDWVLEICGLTKQANLMTGQLPGGWKQRVAFGASVMHEPEILFLDEPTSGVDPLARRQFWRLINEFARQGTAILVTTHYLEEAEQCHRMGFMVAGQVVTQGSPSEIKAAQPGQLLELVTSQTQNAADYLKKQMEPWRVSIFGDRLHLVLDHPDEDLERILTELSKAGISVQGFRPIPFSLEDAFIGIVQRRSPP